ncbi:MAG: hypothetical protein JST66_05640 [Bacteroidetes bacterium]|nr:hypothetical protein [Bacteroidota bacterium]
MPTVIRIPEPCTERWESMPAVEGGRSCGACAHVVPDLTRMTDADLAALVARNALPTCARFRADQLDRVLHTPAPGPLHLAVMSSLLLLPAGADAKKKSAAPQDTGDRPPRTDPRATGTIEFVMGDIAAPETFCKPGTFLGIVQAWPGPEANDPSVRHAGDPAAPGPTEAVAASQDRPAPVPSSPKRPRPFLMAVFFRRTWLVRGWERSRRAFFRRER